MQRNMPVHHLVIVCQHTWTMITNKQLHFAHGLSLGLMIIIIVLTLRREYLGRLIQLSPLHRTSDISSNQGSSHFRLMDDSHAHNDDDSVALKLHEQVRVLVAVMTAPMYLKYRTQAVKDTWAKRCNKIIYLSSEENQTFPTIGLNVTEGYGHLTAKTMTGFDYIYKHYFNDSEWFMKADDDTYVIMENLRYFLSGHNTSEPVYFGNHFTYAVKQGYNGGGAGYVLSKEYLRIFGERGINSKCVKDGGSEDLEIGRCLESLGVRIVKSVDSLGRSRFHSSNPPAHLSGRLESWLCEYDAHGCKKGKGNMSDYVISFHYVRPVQMMELEFYVYHLRPYGIYNGEQKLNIQNNESSHK